MNKSIAVFLLSALSAAAVAAGAFADEALQTALTAAQAQVEQDQKDRLAETCSSINTGITILHDAVSNLKNDFDLASKPIERIGIDMGQRNEVMGVLKGGAAEKAGLKPGIRIFKVNGVDTANLAGGQVRELISSSGRRVEVLAGYLTDREPKKIVIIKERTPILDAAAAAAIKAGIAAFEKRLETTTARRNEPSVKCSQTLMDEVGALVTELDGLRQEFAKQRLGRYNRKAAGTDV